MPILKPADEAQFLFEAAGISLSVVDFRVRERISAPYEVDLTLASEDEISFDDVMAQDALLTILGEEADRYFHGIINQFMMTGSTGKYILYRATVVPMLWMLSLEQDCRIFQKMSASDIIKKVLDEGGVSGDKYDFRLTKPCQPRDYCVQYRESDLNFISRLLEEEGIFYFFEHSKGKHVMVFGDSMVNYQPIEGKAKVPFNPSDGLAPDEEFVLRFVLSKKLHTGKYTMRDFNFKKPSQDMTAFEEHKKMKHVEVYDYPGEYEAKGEGDGISKIRLQEKAMFEDRAEGQSFCPRFVPGFTFELEDHDIDTFNNEYLLVEVMHTGSQTQSIEEKAESGFSYSNHFMGIPSDVIIRPERTTPKPVVEGVQTAIIVGPKGEEIYTDEHGRVKAQFHWDREGQNNEKSSCWIRVSQLWAGAGWGAMFIPRIGHEVIVDFLEGDPDRPIITGRVYHGTNQPPYPLPGDKNRSTIKSDSTLGGGGSNELRFDDTKGAEEVYLHGQKDWTIIIENDKSQIVRHNESHFVGINRDKIVGINQTETIGINKKISVGAEHNETIGANKTIQVGANHTEGIDADMSLEIKKNKSETVRQNSSENVGEDKALRVDKNYIVTVGDNKNQNVGSSKSEKIGASKTVSVGKTLSENIGGNMTVSVGKNLTENISKTHSVRAKKIVYSAEDDITFKVGKATFIMKKNGDISMKGNKILVKGSGKITIKGSKVGEN